MLASGWNIILLCLGAAIMPALSMAAVLMLHESAGRLKMRPIAIS
jgi:hypothetical protein